ncbi:MAG TPA: YIP1 family protein [Chthoniobacterales bacterium]|nr:YIP1 family protein [Chthoniobacterales bacterium]
MATIHVNRGATSLGTFPEEQVREALRAGRFLPTDLGWKEGMANWQPLSQFSEFASDIAAAAPASGVPPPQTPMPPTAIAPAAGSPSTAPRSGLPWDERHTKGFFSAFIETLQMVLTRPGEAFTAMRREGGLGEPLIYALIGGTLGTMVGLFYRFALQSVFAGFGRTDALNHLLGGAALILVMIISPLLVVIGTFIVSAILHLCLMIVGGAKQSFETTFRVVCFSGGSVNPLQLIPICGGLITFVWGLILYCIGLARSHEIETGRAVIAVLLPLIACCGGGFLLLMMFGALGAWSASQH